MPSSFSNTQIWVGGSSDDPHYRYKIPAIKSRPQNKGSYCKTLILNFPTVVKVFSEFYSQANKKLMFKFITTACLKAGGDASKHVLNGEFTSATINEALCKYFDLFVCCPQCSNPETRTITSKRQKRVYVTCLTCGYQGALSKQAKENSFYKTVLKNCDIDDSQVKQIKKNLDAIARERDAAKSDQPSQKEKKKEEFGGKSPNEMSHAEALESFLRYRDRTTPEIIEQIELLTLSRGLESPERWAMLCNAIFSFKALADVKDILAKLDKYAPVFRHFTGKGDAKAKVEAIVFLGYLCWLACKRIAAVPVILAAAVATQSVTADQLITWSERAAAKPIPNWRGAARYGLWEATPEHMVKVKERCEPLIEFLQAEWPSHCETCPDGAVSIQGKFAQTAA